MLKGKFAVLSIGAAALLCLQIAGVSTVNSGIVSKCNSTASSPGTYPADPSDVAFACPKGDVVNGFSDVNPDPAIVNNLTISVTVKDNTNAAIVGMPATDIWAKGCNDGLVLCGGSATIAASAATDALGMTTITGDMATGGCDTGLNVVVQGVVLGGGACPAICLGIAVRTPDFTGPVGGPGGPADGTVTLIDFTDLVKGFPTKYQSPPKPYSACYDLVGSPGFGTINLSDFSKFGEHFNHPC
jgi:hypothetical protein